LLAGTRYRPDENAEEADTIDDLRALLRIGGTGGRSLRPTNQPPF
jgi:hypothetical protein